MAVSKGQIATKSSTVATIKVLPTYKTQGLAGECVHNYLFAGSEYYTNLYAILE